MQYALPQQLRGAALRQQARRLLPVFALIYVPVTTILLSMFLFWFFTGMDTALLTRDPLAIVETELLKIQQTPNLQLYDLAKLNIPLYAGLISNLGILLWTAAAAVSAFAWWMTRNATAPRVPATCLLGGACLSALLMADDFFLLHERWGPVYLGLDEKVVFAAYGLALLAYLFRWRSALLQTDFLLLAAALVGFAVSLSVDAIPDVIFYAIPQSHFFEDGAKFAGIAAWTGYHVHTAGQALRAGIATQ